MSTSPVVETHPVESRMERIRASFVGTVRGLRPQPPRQTLFIHTGIKKRAIGSRVTVPFKSEVVWSVSPTEPPLLLSVTLHWSNPYPELNEILRFRPGEPILTSLRDAPVVDSPS